MAVDDPGDLDRVDQDIRINELRHEAARTRATVRYHQARNAAAHRSRLRYRKRKTKELLAL